eukprot:2209770-Karenia_brevis.AAC.1
MLDLVTVMRLVNINHQRWKLGDVYMGKVDVAKAFDKLFLSAQIGMLEGIGVPSWLSYAYIRIACGLLHPVFDGRTCPLLECTRGVRQGRIDSMR